MLLALIAAASATPPSDPAALAFAEVVAEMSAAAAQLRDATWTAHKLEWVSGRYTPAETFEVKFRPPLDLYMKWPSGQEVLYRPDHEGGRMLARPSGWLPTLHVDPHGAIAKRNQRYTIEAVSMVRTVAIIADDWARLVADADHGPGITDLGTRTEHGATVRCFTSALPKAQHPEYYAAKAEVCFHPSNGLPARVMAWNDEDGAVRLVEDYAFADLRMNVGLTDLDFDPKNEAYDF